MTPTCGPRFQTTVSPGIPIPGPVGPQGNPGIQGPPGQPGANGAGLVVKGTVPTVSNPATDLPQTGNHPGDGYIALDTGDIWTWTGSAWINGGKFGGPPGPQGIPGPVGATGPVGPTGPAGAALPATTTQLGSIIVGGGLHALADGTLSIATSTTSGLALTGGILGVAAGPGLLIQASGVLEIKVGAGLSFDGSSALAVVAATTSVLGGVIVGAGLNVTSGTVSVPVATATVAGRVIAGGGLNVQANGTLSVATGPGIGLTGNNLVLVPATTTSLGGVIVGAGLTIQANGLLSAPQLWQAGPGGAIYYVSGNVGIGIANPAYALDLAGQQRIVVPASTQALLIASGTLAGSIGSNLGGLGLGTTSADSLVLFTASAPRLTVAATGTVTVSGQLVASTGALVLGALQVGTNAISAQPGDIAIARNSAPAVGVIYFGSTGSQAITFDGASYSFQGASLSAGGNLTIGGAATVTGNVNCTGNLTAGSVTASAALNGASLLVTNTLYTATGQVGIGGVWPDQPLTVNGNVHLVNSGAIIFSDGTEQLTAGITSAPAAVGHVVTGSRTPGNAYANTTGKTMFVSVTFAAIASGSAATATVSIGTAGASVLVAEAGGAAAMSGYLFFPVPNGLSYTITGPTASSWVEWY